MFEFILMAILAPFVIIALAPVGVLAVSILIAGMVMFLAALNLVIEFTFSIIKIAFLCSTAFIYSVFNKLYLPVKRYFNETT